MPNFNTFLTQNPCNSLVYSAKKPYPFGMTIANRSISNNYYRYGFQGQEKDNEIYGEGNAYSAKFWQYDARLGRRWNLDPVDQISLSNYSVLSSNPINRIDPLGDDDYSVDKDGNVAFVQKNKKADNFYALGDSGMQFDDNGAIINEMIISTKVGALKSFKKEQINAINNKGEEFTVIGQKLDFGDNCKEAEQVFGALSVFTNKEFTFAKYSSSHPYLGGQNMVYTTISSDEKSDIYGSVESPKRAYNLVRHTHFHPKLTNRWEVKNLDRNYPSAEDKEFKFNIHKNQKKYNVPQSIFHIYAPPMPLIEY